MLHILVFMSFTITKTTLLLPEIRLCSDCSRYIPVKVRLIIILCFLGNSFSWICRRDFQTLKNFARPSFSSSIPSLTALRKESSD